uniref:Oxysterol-binding protein n=1 Tax=Sinocyclocheilus grahami TaxID=75366 RepID=A0A672PCS1_SINGR
AQSVSALDKSALISAVKPTHSCNGSTGSSRHSRQVSEQLSIFLFVLNSRDWEVISDAECSAPVAGMSLVNNTVPGICEGFLMKKRKYPLRGWHKRYFVLDKGVLKYSKTQQDIVRGKIHCALDVSLAVMSVNRKSKRIDLDAGDSLYHVKVCICTTKNVIVVVIDVVNHYSSSRCPLHSSLKSIHESLALERERVRQAWAGPDLRQSTSDQLATLCTTLSEVLFFFFLAREREFCAHSPIYWYGISYSYFSEAANMKYRASVSSTNDLASNALVSGRRTVLPAHSTDNSHIGILTILYNNIGKDLSRVSMPVALNEPLSLLQRVSEELEYSELLDIANHTDDPFERMVYVAAFSISGYAWASWRNRYKPFNPVLGETYENVQEDHGFRYIAEQVSHHPPLSACHAESDNFSFWQDQRWKYKFWGKSVEIVSTGMVNVTLPNYGDHYEWNKAVTCIHNVFSQQRSLEHYGDIVIRNLNNNECTCKITFVKSRYWDDENSKNEVQGTVLDRVGRVLHRFGGSWHEGIFCDTLPNPQCIWKPNPQPDDYFDYYGFSQYARELNELTPDIKDKLPLTDTRFRPDQRLLEDGKVEEADKRKDEIEEKQRERRKAMTKRGEEHVPRFFVKTIDHAGREVWVTNGIYWKIRENPGFASTENLDLWC